MDITLTNSKQRYGVDNVKEAVAEATDCVDLLKDNRAWCPAWLMRFATNGFLAVKTY